VHKKIEREPKRQGKFFWLSLGLFALLLMIALIILTFYPDTVEAAIRNLSSSQSGPKTVTLSADTQKAVVTEAVKELSDGFDSQHEDIVALVDGQDQAAAQSNILPDSPLYPLKELGRRIQESLTFEPLTKTQLILKNNALETVETLALLQKALKDSNQTTRSRKIAIVANQISTIENRFSAILTLSQKIAQTNKERAQTINAATFSYAEKFFRTQFILKGLEEKLSDTDFIQVEAARTKGLTAFARILLSYHPNPQILSSELAKSLAWETGTHYQEIKTVEVLQELEDATPDESQKNSLRLAQYILIERFEKKVLAQPPTKRHELLDALVSKLPGNPMQEFKTMSRIQRVFRSHELILFTELYKAKMLEHFESRVLGLSTETLQTQFVKNWIKDPVDLRILEALELRVNGKNDADPKLAGLVKDLKALAYKEIVAKYGQNPETLKETLFYESATLTPDVLDVKVAVNLDKALDNSTTVKDIEKAVVTKFVDNLAPNHGNISVPSSPETTSLLEEIAPLIPTASLSQVRSEVLAAITAETELASIQVPEINTEINNLVNELERRPEIVLETQLLSSQVTHIEEILSQLETQLNTQQSIPVSELTSEPTLEQVAQRTEEIIQEVLSAPAGVETPVEETLPQAVQQEIEQVQQTANPTPQVDQTLLQTVVNTVEHTQQNAPVTPPSSQTTLPQAPSQPVQTSPPTPPQTQEVSAPQAVSAPSAPESAPAQSTPPAPESPPTGNITVPAL
jgi:hypothetical protein